MKTFLRILFSSALVAAIGCGPSWDTRGPNSTPAPGQTKPARSSSDKLANSKKLLAMSVEKWAEVLNDAETKKQLSDLTKMSKELEGLEADYIKTKNDGPGDPERALAKYSTACVEASKLAQDIVAKTSPKEKNIRDVIDLAMIAVDPADREKLVLELETLTTPHEPLKDPLREVGKFLLPLNELIEDSDVVKKGQKHTDHYQWAARKILEKKAAEAKSKKQSEEEKSKKKDDELPMM